MVRPLLPLLALLVVTSAARADEEPAADARAEGEKAAPDETDAQLKVDEDRSQATPPSGPPAAPASSEAETKSAPTDVAPVPLPPRLPSVPDDDGDTKPAPPKQSEGSLPAPDVDAATEWPTGFMHYGTQTATSCACCGCPGAFGMVAIPISAVVFFIPYIGLVSSLVVLAAPSCLGCAGFALAPLVGSGLGVLWPEWLGDTRGAMAWPMLAGYAVEAFSLVVMSLGVVVLGGFSTVFFVSTLNPAFEVTNPTSGEPVFQNWQLWDFNSLGIGAVAGFVLLAGGVVTAVVAPAIASVLSYDLLAEPKEPDDTGFRFPGIFSANGITPEEREEARLEAEREELERQEKLRIQDKKQEEWKLKQKEREKEREKKKGPKAGEPLPVAFPIRY